MELPNLIVTEEARLQAARVMTGNLADGRYNLQGRLTAAYIEHDCEYRYEQPPGTSVVSETKIIGVVRQASTITEIAITPHTKPDSAVGGSNRTYTVDVLRRASGGSFVSLLSGVITIDNTDTNGVPQFTVPTTTVLARGDQIEVVVVATGSANVQGQGVNVDIFTRQQGAG